MIQKRKQITTGIMYKMYPAFYKYDNTSKLWRALSIAIDSHLKSKLDDKLYNAET